MLTGLVTVARCGGWIAAIVAIAIGSGGVIVLDIPIVPAGFGVEVCLGTIRIGDRCLVIVIIAFSFYVVQQRMIQVLLMGSLEPPLL
jgi:hypothetical protein